ncbi:hypothetical protein D3C72_2591010 [compost metagenome]
MSPTKFRRTPRQLVLRRRNCNDERHSSGHSPMNTTSAAQENAGMKFDTAQ